MFFFFFVIVGGGGVVVFLGEGVFCLFGFIFGIGFGVEGFCLDLIGFFGFF